MNLKLEFEFSKAEIIAEVDALKKQVDALRPLPTDVEGKVFQKLRLDWNYNSNAIEGNKLSYGETVALLMEGITASGKPLKDSLDIRGHDKAIDFLLALAKEPRLISETDIRALHELILVEPYTVRAKTPEGLPTTKLITLGEYKKSPNHVETSTGEIHYYATPEETPAKMQSLMEWYGAVEQTKGIHPIVMAAQFHHKFVEIHPFDDGNGRLSRILMNLILMRHGYPPVVVKIDDRQNYYALLSRSDRGESWPFVEYIAELAKNPLQLYLKAANGGDIDEDEDIDKEIALFKMELSDSANLKKKKSKETVINLIKSDILDLFTLISNKTSSFEEYFFKSTQWIKFYFDTEDFNDGDLVRFYKNDHVKVLDYLASNDKKFNYVILDLDYNEFRNAKNAFNIIVRLRINFDEYEYSIINYKGEKLISKYYHEQLSVKDKQPIVKDTLSTLMQLIQKEQKSSKP